MKHIHHHKKIYITNHPASSQYAPEYLPGSEGATTMTKNAIISADSNNTPLDSVEVYENIHVRQPLYATSVSEMLPLYRARGYYGPPPFEWDENQYNENTPLETTDAITSKRFESGSTNVPPNKFSKKPKFVRVKESLRTKPTHRNKVKQLVIRGKPVQEEEHPVSTFHEKFYADIQGVGTIRKIKKPQRVEKIIDGDTEHIHTYSEEHIHKLVFDDGSKVTDMPSDDPFNNIAIVADSRPSNLVKNSQSLVALPSNPFIGFAYGPMETPANLEYAAYHPHEVTHDHIFHDHGEMPIDVDVSKDPLLYPPKVSYNSKGVKIGVGPIDNLLKYQNKHTKSTKTTPVTGFSYQENFPYEHTKNRNSYKNNDAYYDPLPQNVYDEFRPISFFNYKEKGNLKSNSLTPSVYFESEPTQQTSVPTPFAVSSTIIHDYTPKRYSGRITGSTRYSKSKDPWLNFKNSYANRLEYDTYGVTSNFYPTSEKGDEFTSSLQGRKGTQKSVSEHNVHFLSLDHNNNNNNNYGDFYNEAFSSASNDQNLLTSFHNNEEYEVKHTNIASSTPPNNEDSSSAYSYYSAVAIKALHDEEQATSTPSYKLPVGTKASITSEHYNVMNINSISTPSPNFTSEQKHKHRAKNSGSSNVHHNFNDYLGPSSALGKNSKASRYLHRTPDESSSPSSRLKYGDKLNS